MAINFYEKGQLSSGFCGWRVVVTIRGKRYQKCFSLNRPSKRIPEELWFRYQQPRDRYCEARWQARSAAVQYREFISKNHYSTLPNRGEGFQGITLGIGRGNRCKHDKSYFSVNLRGRAAKVFITEDRPLTAARHHAVGLWREGFEIRPKDIAAKRKLVPAPDQFKALRKQMNEKEGTDVSASVLHHVYEEQREEIEKLKVAKGFDEPATQDELLAFSANLQREIEAFCKACLRGMTHR
ncbi:MULTISPECIES: hypothetical protein [Marinobacter]|uniref:hypothetical protein n=1 Tax=Marinobacter TaxID=2742 RepID=UPI003B439139|nr:hypothetical protein PBN92_07175 [Marinobacter alkaliphilus]